MTQQYLKYFRKTFLSFVVVICFIHNSYAQSKFGVSEKYKQAGLVWGLLKYHHPDISNGIQNWDSELIKLIDKTERIQTQTEMNDLLISFVAEYGTSNLKPRKATSKDLFVKNSGYNWIDPKVFGDELTRILLQLKENGNVNNYYASTSTFAKMLSFKNEKGFEGFKWSVKSHRLLLLYSFWNAIEYWDVNKYLMDVKWSDNLEELTKCFAECETKLEFEIIKAKLISKLNDSHSYYLSATVNDSLFKYKPLFSVKTINDSLIVHSIYDKKLATKDDIELGDIITKVNNKSILSCLNEKIAPLISVSNPAFLKKWSTWLLYNAADSINVDIVKSDGSHKNKYIRLYMNQAQGEVTSLETSKKEKWYFVKDNIGYINLELVNKKELNTIFKQIANTKGLILDLRNYPKNILASDIPEYLYPKRKEFIKVLFPIENYPSFGEYDGAAPLQMVSDPFEAGRDNPDYYKGKVILLVNKRTQSKAEFIGMAIQQSPNCFTIGENTAGSVMNIVRFILPDKTEVSFTGLGAFYPDGKGVQREGLTIDYYVKETAKNYDPELYLKEAVRLIDEKK